MEIVKITNIFQFLFKLFFLISYISTNDKNKIVNNYDSIIQLIISGKGRQNILGDFFKYEPSAVIINGISKGESCEKSCDFDKDINNVTLIFDYDITDCSYMFYNLISITEIDLSECDASKVTTMNCMFGNCVNLEKIKFGNINTSSVNNMLHLFYNCNKLSSIDLSNFDTSQVIYMSYMFSGCSNLKEIDVSKFNTSLVTLMGFMFKDCTNLKYLNLSNFDTSKVLSVIGMFENCQSLIYLNLYSFKISNSVTKDNAFKGTNVNLKFCINDIETKNYLLGNNKESQCSDKCFNKNIKIDIDKQNICVESCDNDKYEFNNICYNKCPEGTLNNNNNCEVVNKCYKNYEECSSDAPEGYYYDINDSIYKKCYDTCKYCKGKGDKNNNNCIECKFNYIFLNDSINNNNCYQKCEYYYFFDEFNNYTCTEDYICPEQYNKLIEEKKRCIDECENDNIYKNEYKNICYIICPNNTFETKSKCYDSDLIATNKNNLDIINNSFYINEETNIMNISQNEKDKNIEIYREYVMDDDIIKNVTQNKEDFTTEKDGVLYQITTSENQKNNSNKNISTIDLGDCEKELKRIYQINESLPLIIFKIDYYSPDTLIPIVGYEIYHPLNKTKLDLIYCEEILVKLNIPVSIDENSLYKYDPNSGFYTDNCFSYTTENGTDIILNDRKQEFVNNNLSLCENGCNYTGYDQDMKQSSCNCSIKNKMDLISDIVNNPNKLSNNFNSDNGGSSSSSIVTIKCTKNLFSKEGLKNNISSYILIIFIFTFLLCLVLFLKCGYPLLNNDINDIIKEKEKIEKKK